MISDEGIATLIYDTYQNKGQSHVNELKEYKVRVEVFPQNNNKRVRPNHKEYLKKKKLKKQQRMAEVRNKNQFIESKTNKFSHSWQLEEARESEKNKWLQFNNKTSKKQVIILNFIQNPQEFVSFLIISWFYYHLSIY